MGTLRDEIREANEERQIELDHKQNARVREIQLALAEDLELARAVPAALKALDKEHRAAVKETLETLEMIDLATLTPRQGEIVDTVRNRVRHILSLLDNGAARATNAVKKVDNLTFAEIKDWSPTEYARALRNDLRSATSAPQVVRQVMEGLPQDMESIRRIMKDGPRVDPMGDGARERESQRGEHQTHAHSNTQGT